MLLTGFSFSKIAKKTPANINGVHCLRQVGWSKSRTLPQSQRKQIGVFASPLPLPTIGKDKKGKDVFSTQMQCGNEPSCGVNLKCSIIGLLDQDDHQKWFIPKSNYAANFSNAYTWKCRWWSNSHELYSKWCLSSTSRMKSKLKVCLNHIPRLQLVATNETNRHPPCNSYRDLSWWTALWQDPQVFCGAQPRGPVRGTCLRTCLRSFS